MNNKQKIQIAIIPATPADAKDVQEIFYRTWLATYPNEEAGVTRDDIEDYYKNAFTEETIRDMTKRIENLPPEMRLIVAKVEGKVIGLCRVMLHDDKNQLQAIYVLPEYQGLGVGTKLWNEAKNAFNPTLNTVVHVATYNTNAIKFYKGLGFVESGKRWQDEKFKMKSGASIPEMEMVMKVN